MSDDNTFRNMPSLAPSDPPSRSDQIDNQFRHLSYKLDELIGIVSQLNGDEGVSKLTKLTYKLEDLDTKLTDKLEDFDNRLDGLDASLAFLIKMCLMGSILIFVFWLLSFNPSWWFATPLLAIYGWYLYRINKEL